MKKGNSKEVINTVNGLQKALLFTTCLPSIHKKIENKPPEKQRATVSHVKSALVELQSHQMRRKGLKEQ